MYTENMEVQSEEPTTTIEFPINNICLKYPNQQLETTRAYELFWMDEISIVNTKIYMVETNDRGEPAVSYK